MIKDAKQSCIKKELRKRYSCYVLITCSEPSEHGDMSAELSYEGDELLASYLIENARQLFEERECQSL